MIKTLWHNLKHKIFFWKGSNLKDLLKTYGLTFLVLIIIWEIIEDILFPIVWYYLGSTLNPMFYSLIPVSWLMCLHPFVMPLLLYLSYRINKRA